VRVPCRLPLLVSILFLTLPFQARSEPEAVAGFLAPTPHDLNAAAFDPKGERVAAAGEDGNVYLWDATTGKALGVLEGRRGPLTSVGFSPADQVVSGSENGYLTFWDVGRKQIRFGLSQDQVKTLAVSPDGNTLATAAGKGVIRVWKLDGTDKSTGLEEHRFWPSSLLFAGDLLVSADANGLVVLWDGRTGKKLMRTLTGHTPIGAVALSEDLKRLRVATEDGTVRDFDTTTGKELRSVSVDVPTPARCVLSPSGSVLACATSSGAVHLFNVSTQKKLAVLRESGPKVWSLTFSADGSKLASVGERGSIAVWKNLPETAVLVFRDADTVRFPKIVEQPRVATEGPASGLPSEGTGHLGPVRAVCFAPDGRSFAAADDGGEVRLWNVANTRAAWAQQSHRGSVRGLAFSPDGRAILSGGDDGMVRIWDARKGDEGTSFRHGGRILSVAWSPDGTLAAAAGVGGRVRVWNRSTGKEPVTVEKQTGAVAGIVFTPDGKHLACAGGSDLRFFSVATGAADFSLKGAGQPTDALSFDRNGETLAAASADGVVRIWDLKSRKILSSVEGAAELGACVALSPDGKTVAFSGDDSTVRLCDTATGKTQLPPLSHPQRVLSLAWSPDGISVVTGCRDGSVRLWRVERLP
jgi:WD40 repeat protein